MPTSDAPRTPSTAAKSSGGFSLTNKVGPLPIWVYMVVIVAALYVYEKKKKAGASTATTAAAAKAAGTGIDPNTGIPYSQESTGVGQSTFEQYLGANAGTATTNPQWEANAEAVLVGQGYPSVQVQSALNSYLAGGVLSSVQQEIVNAVISAVGAPPSAPNPPPGASGNSPPVGLTGQTTGSGYGTSSGAGSVTSDGQSYSQLPGYAELNALLASGGTAYIFPTAGGPAVPVNQAQAAQLGPNTPTFQLAGGVSQAGIAPATV